MSSKINRLLIYKNLKNIIKGKKRQESLSAGEMEILDKMHGILSKEEPDYDALFHRINRQISAEQETGEFNFNNGSRISVNGNKSINRRNGSNLVKFNPRRRHIAAVVTRIAAAVVLLVVVVNYAERISAIINGYKSKANPEIVAKLTQVHDRHRATLIIDDTISFGIFKDTVVYNQMVNDVTEENRMPEEKRQMHTLVIPRGGEFFVTLPDGSEVYLNSESKLTFPSSFQPGIREVYLTGEALFKVVKGDNPFTVITGNSITKVLGTEFNIKSGETTDLVTLCSGTVEVSTSALTGTRVLVPEQQASVTGTGINVKKVDIREIVAWTEGKYYFRNIPLEEIAGKLYDWYDVDFNFSNGMLKDVPFTGMINRNSSLKTIFELFEMSYDITFTIEEDCILIHSKSNQKLSGKRFTNK